MADIEDHPDYDLDCDKHRLAFIVTNLRTGRQFEFLWTSSHRLYMYYPRRRMTTSLKPTKSTQSRRTRCLTPKGSNSALSVLKL